MNKRILITGVAGFSGVHFVRHLIANTEWDIVGLDRLNYAGTLERLREFRDEYRFSLLYHDFRSPLPTPILRSLSGVRAIIHAGAETHVARSLISPGEFVLANVLGTQNVLDAARILGVEHFIQVSTDEVTGPTPEGEAFNEQAPLRPSNPYSATKAGAEMMCNAYLRSFGVPVTITRCQNIFGEMQHGEKFIPLAIRKVLRGETLDIHADKEGQSGSRMWVHARNEADAILHLLKQGSAVVGGTFHIVGEGASNLEIAERIAAILERPLHHRMVDIKQTLPGHDLHYRLDQSKIEGIGWHPPVSFHESLVKTVLWYKDHQEWLEP